ncbi:MAG TPA: cell division protein FtsZ [Geminicoccaceae bacterium]|nr:cell division protein FtsZ [Geminicoccaceae bacterium]
MTINLSMPVNHELRPRISVVGVGGAGTNAVNNMITAHLEGVEFLACNTDAQSLAQSLTERRIQLGTSITQGLGAGARPEIGRAAAEEAVDELLDQLQNSHMVFITAGMGGGTGTGAAPVIARAVREQGILTVGVVTKPFHFEGAHRMRVAEGGLAELQQYVDTLIVIPNQNLFRIANERTTFAEAFKLADNVLHMGVRGVTDLMVMPGLINLDFADIRTVMSEMGKAMMGTGEGSGERRAIEAAEAAISNPLLDEVSMRGARGVLINITGGHDMTLFEVDEAANRIKEEVDPDANIIVGSTLDESLEGEMRVSVVATGIEARGATAAAAEVPASKPTTLSMPSFRLRAQPAKTASAAAKSAPAAGAYAADDQPAETRVSGADRERDHGEAPASQPEPADAEHARTRQPAAGAPGYWQPPLPPQERFQEWGKLRAPVRGAERPPSLFERVTASFRKEREGGAEPARGRPEMAESALATTEEDPYDIPAFLRR